MVDHTVFQSLLFMADEIRKKLKEEGVEIEDTSEGTIWRSI